MTAVADSADQVAEIARALDDSPVYVEPGLLPQGRIDTLTSSAGGSDVPVYVVYVSLDYFDEFHGSAGPLLSLVAAERGVDGVYVSVSWDDTLEVRERGVDEQVDARMVADREGAPADKLERFVDLVATGTGEQAYQEQRESGSAPGPAFLDELADSAAGLAALAFFGAVVWAFSHQVRLRHDSRQVARVFAVPPAVVASARGARTQEVEEQARTALLALGTALEATDVPAGGRALAEYRAALDAYDAAGRTSDRAANLADAVGALVVAEMGQAHLRRATGRQALRRQAPPRPCYFNPLHGAARGTVSAPGVPPSAASVPACSDCAARIGRGDDPDVLVVTADGRDVPYHESGLEPWAVTGYGSLRYDLVERILTGADRID